MLARLLAVALYLRLSVTSRRSTNEERILTTNSFSQPGTIPTTFSTAFCPNLKLLNITYVNVLTTSHCPWMSVLLWNKTLYIECCSETFINVAFMFHTRSYIFPQTIQCISHLLFRCCMCVCLMLLKYYLLTYLVTSIETTERIWLFFNTGSSVDLSYTVF